jgi:hypothetical protein
VEEPDRSVQADLYRQARASTFRLDVKGGEVRRALDQARIPCVLLKGAGFARLLYDRPETRLYGDVDLLIDPARASAAHEVLRRLGFRPFDPESLSGQSDPGLAHDVGVLGAVHGGAWLRDDDNLAVDLHHTLPQVTIERSVAWEELRGRTIEVEIAGAPTRVLDKAASALLVALHAAHDGPAGRGAIRDLELAAVLIDLASWRDARELARRLGAERAMGVGLGLVPGGVTVAAALGLDSAPTPAIKLQWSGASWSASTVEALASGGLRPGLRLVLQLARPSPEAMRSGSSLARRGRRGLLAAYLLRAGRLARRAPGAVAEWRRHRT